MTPHCALERTPREAMDLLVAFGIAARSPAAHSELAAPAAASPTATHPARSTDDPALAAAAAARRPPTRRRAGSAPCWREEWPLAGLREQHRRLWRRSVADELDLGWDRGRLTIPITRRQRRPTGRAALPPPP